MSSRFLINTLLLGLLFLCCGLPASAQGAEPSYQVFVFWRGDALARENLDQMRLLQVDCCLLPVVHITYNPGARGLTPTVLELNGLSGEDAIGLNFYAVADISLWDKGWDGVPDVPTLAFMISDLSQFAIDAIEKASGNIRGIIIRPTDKKIETGVLIELLKGIKNNPAFLGRKGFEFGVIVKPEWMDSPDFRDLAFVANIIIGDFTAMDPLGFPPRLVDTDWVVKGAWRLDATGKPFVAALPMYEQVIESDNVNSIVNPDVTIPFDILIDNADKASTDSAGNATAVFTNDKTVDNRLVPAGEVFTRLQPHPGKLMEIVNTLYGKDINNLRGIALDGLPYEPSGGGQSASVYISSLKGATIEPAENVKPDLFQEKDIPGNYKAQSKVLRLLALIMLGAMILTGLSVWRKKRLTYDEDTGKLKRTGGNKG